MRPRRMRLLPALRAALLLGIAHVCTSDSSSSDDECLASCKTNCAEEMVQDIVTDLVATAASITDPAELSALLANVTAKVYNQPVGFYPFVYNFDGVCLAHGENPDYVGETLGQITGGSDTSYLNELFINAAKSGAVSHFLSYNWDDTTKFSYLMQLDTNISSATSKDTLMYVGSGFYGVSCEATTTTKPLHSTTTSAPPVNRTAGPVRYCIEYETSLVSISVSTEELPSLTPTGLVVDTMGNIYFLSDTSKSSSSSSSTVTWTSNLYVYSPTSGTSLVVSSLASPFELVIDPENMDLLVSCTASIVRISCLMRDWTDAYCKQYSDAATIPFNLQLTMTLTSIRGMTMTRGGSIFFVDDDTGGLYLHNLVTIQVASGLDQPYDVEIDETTFNLFVSTVGETTVFVLPCLKAGQLECEQYADSTDFQVGEEKDDAQRHQRIRTMVAKQDHCIAQPRL